MYIDTWINARYLEYFIESNSYHIECGMWMIIGEQDGPGGSEANFRKHGGVRNSNEEWRPF